MREYTPFYMPEVTVLYRVRAGQSESFINPGYPPEIEIDEVLVHENEISELLQSHLLEHHETTWKREIINQLRMGEAA